MGKGIDAARAIPGSELHAAMIDDMKDQLIIVLMKRLAKDGQVRVPVAELDDTGNDVLAFSISEDRVFHFELSKKS